jgi:hypothetical protein
MEASSDNREVGRQAFLRRRDFLAFGSVGIASLCLGDFAWAQGAPAGGALPLPVAYLDGSEMIRNLKHLPRSVRHPATEQGEKIAGEALRFTPADRVPLGDTNLVGRPLRLRIHGLYPPAALSPKRRRELPHAIDLDVLFPAPDPAFPEPARYQAWSFRRQHGWNASPPVSFPFPLDWYVYPEIEMKVTPADGGAPVTMRTRFTLDDESGLPRLRRGLYMLGLKPGTWRGEAELSKLGGVTPADLFSVLLSLEPEGEE